MCCKLHTYIQKDLRYAWEVTSCVSQTAPMGVIPNNSVSQIEERGILTVIWSLHLIQTIWYWWQSIKCLHLIIWTDNPLNTMEIWVQIWLLETKWIYLKPNELFKTTWSLTLKWCVPSCKLVILWPMQNAHQLLFTINTHWVPVVCEVGSGRI